MGNELTFITGNPNKARQLADYLNQPVHHHVLSLPEIQSLDLAEIIHHKAIEAYNTIKKPVIVDDTSLIIAALGKLPGPFIKYFLQEMGSEKICQLVDSFNNRGALAEVGIGYCNGSDFHLFLGQVEGMIAKEPKGTNGFGWDSLFVPNTYSQTRAEMEAIDYDATSPRKIAIRQLSNFLKEHAQ